MSETLYTHATHATSAQFIPNVAHVAYLGRCLNIKIIVMDFASELKTELSIVREPVVSAYTLWFYKTSNLEGFTRMGLMTGDQEEAQKQLTKIYGEPVDFDE